MTPQYQHYHKQALDLQYHFHDVIDNQHDPRMQQLQKEVHALVEDIAQEKHPRSVEERLKIIDHQLLEARTSPMHSLNFNEIDGLHHSYQQLRNDVRREPNY